MSSVSTPTIHPPRPDRTAAPAPPQIGQSPDRPEDPELLAGAGEYVPDFRMPGCIEAAFVRSPVAHGRLTSVDASPAEEIDGVIAAYAAADLPGIPTVPPAARSMRPPGMARPALATDRVRFVGEPVAVVLARDRYAAADAAELVSVDIDPLPCVTNASVAATEEAPRLFDGLDNVCAVWEHGAPVDEALASAPVVADVEVVNQRLAPASLEARGILVAPQRDGTFRIWCSHQAPHRLRGALSQAFGIDESRIRVTVPYVGGAFGGKSHTFAEYLVVFELARRHRCPVRWVEERNEALTASTHGRGQRTRIRLAADHEGRFLALHAEIDGDVGAYPDSGDFVPEVTGWVMSGPYRIPQLYVHARSIVTNATPTAPYRGAGRPEAAYAIERVVDRLAELLGRDPVELRLLNFVPEDEFPYRSPTGAVYDSGRYASALRLATRLGDYEGWRTEQRRRRADKGTAPLLGVGVASWIERTGGQAGSGEYAHAEVTADGLVRGAVGTASQGQGHAITMSQVLADALGIGLDRIRIELGDTAATPRGTGAFGSRSMQVGGSALYRAGENLLVEARARAATLLGEEAENLVYAGGVFTAPSASDGLELDLAEIVRRTGRLVGEEYFGPPQAFPFGSYLAVVEVDHETGQVHVLRFVAVDDCGVVVNPAVVRGQILGSIAQGVGQALYEGFQYDEGGQPLTASFLDYRVPTAVEVPAVELGEHVTPNPNVPIGAKGTGESGCIGAPPAIVGAIWDALAGYQRTDLDMPITSEKVWNCLQRPEGGGTPS
ncbi:MAG: molybdopterin-dependent oxidoreductase [Streptosporangiales bacterium]|nr:molybdopterin-dependent oxidoreductase [Streptosporangiales bacterium]